MKIIHKVIRYTRLQGHQNHWPFLFCVSWILHHTVFPSAYQKWYHIKFFLTNCINFTACNEFTGRTLSYPLSSSNALGQGVRALDSSCFIFASFCQSFQKRSYLLGNTLSTICMLFVHKAQNCHFSSQRMDFNACLIWAKDSELLALLGCVLTCV